MIDFDKQIVEALSAVGLPCYYENFITNEIAIPCITYVENNNSSYLEGDALRYSHINYTVKLWMDNKSQQSYLDDIDATMKRLGFKRNSSSEIADGNVIEKIMDYEAIGWEDFVWDPPEEPVTPTEPEEPDDLEEGE